MLIIFEKPIEEKKKAIETIEAVVRLMECKQGTTKRRTATR
jgi:hypothetical protein